MLALALVLALTLKTFVVDAVTVPTRSMEPSVLPGDYVLLDKIGFAPSAIASRLPSRGDVVAFDLPDGDPDEGSLGLKRCIAVEGDTVEYRQGTIFVNGVAAVRGVGDGGPVLADGEPHIVPDDGVFVFGDNHAVSLDSRTWGWIPARSVVGKAALVYWSLGDDGAVRWSRVGSLVR